MTELNLLTDCESLVRVMRVTATTLEAHAERIAELVSERDELQTEYDNLEVMYIRLQDAVRDIGNMCDDVDDLV